MRRATRIRRFLKKNTAKLAIENNDQAHAKLVKNFGQHDCRVCPPWKGDNAIGKKHGKHGKTKPKYKNKR